MKIKLCLFGCFLSLLLFFLVSGISQVSAKPLCEDPTPTVTETPSPSPTWVEFIKTSTPRPKVDASCPNGNPTGWGYVTPDSFWEMSCSQCITRTPKAAWPTYQIATMAPAGTLDPTIWPTQFALSQTVSPTIVVTTPAPNNTPTPTGTWYGLSRLFAGHQVYAQQGVTTGKITKTWLSADVCGAPNSITAVKAKHTRPGGGSGFFWYPGGTEYGNSASTGFNGNYYFRNSSAELSYLSLITGWSPYTTHWVSIPNDTDKFTLGFNTSTTPGDIYYFDDVQFVCKNYNYAQPTTTPTATVGPTAVTGMCASVKAKVSDQALLPSIKVGPLVDANCTKFPGVWIAKTSPLWTIPCGLVECNIPDAGIGFPRVHVCYRPIRIDGYEILSQPIDMNLLMFIAGAVMILRYLRKK